MMNLNKIENRKLLLIPTMSIFIIVALLSISKYFFNYKLPDYYLYIVLISGGVFLFSLFLILLSDIKNR